MLPLTLCTFGSKEIKFWRMLFSSEGVKPDPEKIKALEDVQLPKNKEELKSFICMKQSNRFHTLFLEISCTLENTSE